MAASESHRYFRLLPHGQLKEQLPGVYTITGSMRLFGLFQYSRVMTILKDGPDLALVNPVRVNDAELARIEELGRVKHIFKIGALHNMDLPFYMDRYSPRLWVTKGDKRNHGYEPNYFFDDFKELPFLSAQVQVVVGSKVPETLIVTPQDGGCLHSCDAFVNMAKDPNHNLLTSTLSRLLPQPTYVGPNWIKMAKPPAESLLKVLDYDFEHFVPAHGEPIIGFAKSKIAKYLATFYG